MPATLIGLDLGASHTKAVRCTPEGAVLAEAHWTSIPPDRDPLEHLIANLYQLGPEPPLAVGVAICGLIAPDGSTMLHAPNAVALQGLPYREAIQAHFGVPVALLNDAKAFVYAEHQIGAIVGLSHVLGCTLGTGIGGGLILDGGLYLGARGWLGEIGHIPLDPEGPECPCGLTGCLETYIAAAHVVAHYNASLTDPRSSVDSPRTLIERAGVGDPDAVDAWYRYGFYLGLACAHAITLLDLEALLFGGGLAHAFPYFEPSLLATLEDQVERYEERGLTIHQAQLGEHAGAIGAALWAVRACL